MNSSQTANSFGSTPLGTGKGMRCGANKLVNRSGYHAIWGDKPTDLLHMRILSTSLKLCPIASFVKLISPDFPSFTIGRKTALRKRTQKRSFLWYNIYTCIYFTHETSRPSSPP